MVHFRNLTHDLRGEEPEYLPSLENLEKLEHLVLPLGTLGQLSRALKDEVHHEI